MIKLPFEHEYFIGYINQVFPQFVRVHFPSSMLLKTFTFLGEELSGGLVGNFVIIEGEKYGFLGKILELALPEKERLELSEKSFNNKEFHPIGKIEILLGFDLFEPSSIVQGLNVLPAIGAKVFVCSSKFVNQYFKSFGVKAEDADPLLISLGSLPQSKSSEIEVSQQAIFSRHCAVVGTTGGGKSFTLSRLIEGLITNGAKAILIDATGEYSGGYLKSKSVNLGDGKCAFNYSQLTIDDLFYLFKPSSKTQIPKLMEAIRSLKMVKLANASEFSTVDEEKAAKAILIEMVDGLLLKKESKTKRVYDVFYYRMIEEIENGKCDFDINQLAAQITAECVYDTAKADSSKYGGRSEGDVSYCISLISRINNLINSKTYQKIFAFKDIPGQIEVTREIENFINDPDLHLLRLNFGGIPFEFQVREILANAIGRYLLTKARNGDFKDSPVVLLMDEAHQFLNKTIKDEYFDGKELDAFDSIAKECRKHGLFLCLATQMPRDIPLGTLSQIGTFLVHRLINQFDKESIANACSSANRNSLEFLPTLGAGEAILMGVEFPMPLMIRVHLPKIKPESDTPRFKRKSSKEG